jgi:hypothetical protein
MHAIINQSINQPINPEGRLHNRTPHRMLMMQISHYLKQSDSMQQCGNQGDHVRNYIKIMRQPSQLSRIATFFAFQAL